MNNALFFYLSLTMSPRTEAYRHAGLLKISRYLMGLTVFGLGLTAIAYLELNARRKQPRVASIGDSASPLYEFCPPDIDSPPIDLKTFKRKVPFDREYGEYVREQASVRWPSRNV